ncbi:MLO-like protein [Quillaja saponaria]|uniref:MLO-like protein n=1 Tax=Quillaja saponaria TaxID=32244 RepID=A0AAD7M628_QUISA|nr:MLO-like protein [Quillaja saponaria]
MATKVYERTLEETPTWAVTVVCFVLVAISIFIEHIIHIIGKWCKNKHKRALFEAAEKVKAELMLMGFISLLLTVLQGPISDICIPESVGDTWHPCPAKLEKETSTESDNKSRKLLEFLDAEPSLRRILATKGFDKCADKGKVALVSSYGIHQLHIFIFVLAVFHILYCITTLALGRTKMRKWKAWEDETKTIEYKFYNDPERFRFTRDTTFGRRHLHFWSRSSVSLWIVCFFRQFLGSVTKVDYTTLRHGFIMAHLAPRSESRFDFQKYISRSLEEDFKVVVGISPIIWFFALLFFLSNTHGWKSYLWLPFIPLIIILLVGAKLQVIITKMGLKIQERGAVVMGAPVVQPGDDLFWFNRPRLILYLIHFVLFQNAFQLAFFAWSTYEFSLKSCFHNTNVDIAIRITTGVVIHVVCSYVTLPLYALVTQMGSTMKPTIFNERVAAALKNWHHTAKKHVKQSHQSEANTPFSSRPASPSPRYGMSPVHLLQNNRGHSDSLQTSPRIFNHENEHWDGEGSNSPHKHTEGNDTQNQVQEPSSTQLPPVPPPKDTEHEISISISNLSFRRP